ncbi:Stigma-specific protein Stig1 protein [Raphanus sativus]|nr:Stigma-specific protein Stig1 protein [Raphanus sativus]
MDAFASPFNGGGGSNSTTVTCCNNKCIDVASNDKNCGACKNKCKFSQTCCRGQCVYVAYDKRHCGQCNHPCEMGELCVYSLCNYAQGRPLIEAKEAAASSLFFYRLFSVTNNCWFTLAYW